MIDIAEAIDKLPVHGRVTRVYHDTVNDAPSVSVRAVWLGSRSSAVIRLQVFSTQEEAIAAHELINQHLAAVKRLMS